MIGPKKWEQVKRAKSLLLKTILVSRWGFFETYLRAAARVLFRMFPESLAKGKRGHTSASYTEILEYSAQFQSIETLREKLVEREIANSENEESVHGLINFLIEAFVLSPDPYQAVYVFEGKKKQVSYGKLMELKTVRNAIVHQGGSFSEDDRALSAAVRGLDGGIQIDDEYDLESHCVLLAIASAIDEAIKRKSRD